MALSGHDLSGKRVVVTGASRGIGRSIAVAMAREGCDVAITGRSTALLEEVAREIEDLGRSSLALTADMTVDDEVRGIARKTLDAFGRVDVLVNNAATIYPRTNLVDFDFDDWRAVMDVNVVSVALLTQAVLPSMIQRRAGKIINISSIGGKYPSAGQTPYKTSKAALISLTGCVAAEVKQHGIDVNCICPGGVDTDGFRALFGDAASRLNPMSSDAIADVALFLASDRSRALTGTSIDAFGLSSPIFR
jgi:NAD(P)-dependent dehydrogenase (short-subunit alcohol dehydrogenase family)